MKKTKLHRRIRMKLAVLIRKDPLRTKRKMEISKQLHPKRMEFLTKMKRMILKDARKNRLKVELKLK